MRIVQFFFIFYEFQDWVTQNLFHQVHKAIKTVLMSAELKAFEAIIIINIMVSHSECQIVSHSDTENRYATFSLLASCNQLLGNWTSISSVSAADRPWGPMYRPPETWPSTLSHSELYNQWLMCYWQSWDLVKTIIICRKAFYAELSLVALAIIEAP